MSNDIHEALRDLIDEVRLSQAATDRFDQAVADAIGVNRTDMRCLDTLDREGAVPAGRLAEATGLSSGAITTALDRLERAGYARRVHDPGDRRRVLVELTPAVRELTLRYYGSHAELAEQLLQRYSQEQMELIRGFIRAGREFNERHAEELERANQERDERRAAARD
ncbi:MAG: MarR family transcriptional regulator [Solirubrobacteraceae bacterium]|jgi:DNA-binding MarR family transcriptional regulator